MEAQVIATPRIVLRALEEDDVATLHELFGEEGVLRYFPNSSPPSLESIERMVYQQSEQWRTRGYGLWAVEGRTDGILMGRCGLHYLHDTDEVEVDFILGRAFWGNGFASEAGSAALRFGFERHELSEIVGIVHLENRASQRVLEKIGLKCSGRARYFGMDVYRYSVSHEQYHQREQSRLAQE